jgi:hypothetical protein
MADRFATLGPEVVHGLLAEAPDLDPEVYTRMADVMATIVKRAAERGEIPTADVPDRILTAPTNLLPHEMLFAREPLPGFGAHVVARRRRLPAVGQRKA